MRASVVMPAFNGVEVIAGALRSIADQTRPVDEIVIVDDGSSDGTAAVVETWRDRLPITYLCNDTNLGIGVSLKRGVEAASGDLVLRLDVDDRWLVDHVASLEQLATEHPEAVLVSSAAERADASGMLLGASKCVNDGNVRARLMWDNPLVHSATGFRRDAYLDVGGYRDGVCWEDYDLWIRLLRRGSLAFQARPTATFTVSTNSLSRIERSAALAARWKLQRAAMTAFWRRHPLSAAKCCVLGSLRALLRGGAA